jgi:beta-lactamase regulating signal transducer with metallopeptidase domain
MHPIDSLFDWFLSATWRGSLLILAVLVVQAAVGRRLPAVWRHALWLPVLFVLGAPVLPESPLSLENRWTSGALPVVAVEMDPGSADRDGIAVPVVATPTGKTIDWRVVAGIVWITGALAFLLIGWIACGRTLASFRRGARPLSADLLEEIRESAETCGLRRVPQVLLSKAVPGPAMTGLFKPLLLLPDFFETKFDREERRLILLHEFTHVKRGDLVLNAIAFFLQALHWCNPLVWFAFLRFRADRELACDSAVLSMNREDGRARYGHALLKVESPVTPVSWRLGFIGLVGLFGRGRILHSRIAAIAGHRRSHPLWNLAGPGMLLVILLTGATRAQNESGISGGTPIVIETKFIEVPTDAKIEILSSRSTYDARSGVMVFSADNDAGETLASTAGADILSAPSVVTLSGQKATIEIGQEVPDAAGKLRHIGTWVEILPTLKDDGQIDLSLHARNTRVIPATENKSPSFAEREIKTRIAVMPGDTLIVSSLDQDQTPTPAKRLLLTVRARFFDNESAVRARLEKIIIPKIELKDASLSDAIAFLHERARELDPEKKGVNLVHIPAEGTPEPLITVSFMEIPLTEALKYLAALSGLEVEFGDPSVVLRKPGQEPFPSPDSKAETAKVPVPVKPSGKSADLAAGIILPKVIFEEASLPDVLQFLQQKSLEHDPAKKGLNLILKAPGEPAPGMIRISLSLREVPLSEALRYVAELANLKLRYDDDAVVLFRD